MLPVDAEAERGSEEGKRERFMIAVERESGAKVPPPTPSTLYTSTTNPSNQGDPATESQTSVCVTLGQTESKDQWRSDSQICSRNFPQTFKYINIPESPDSLKRLPLAKDAQGSDMSRCMRR